MKMGLSKSHGGMGFRDLTSFNKAMLTKPLWHIFQKPNSLVSQTLQCKYFSHGDVLNVVQGLPSYGGVSRPLFPLLKLVYFRILVMENLAAYGKANGFQSLPHFVYNLL